MEGKRNGPDSFRATSIPFKEKHQGHEQFDGLHIPASANEMWELKTLRTDEKSPSVPESL